MTFGNNIAIKEYHYPDEYVDSVMTVGDETGEHDLLLPLARDILRYLMLPIRRRAENNQQQEAISDNVKYRNEANLSAYHLPDGYCDNLTINCDDNDSSNVEALSTRVFPFGWIRSLVEEIASSLDNLNSSNCHLPEEYVDSAVSYNESPAQDQIIHALKSFLARESNNPESGRQADSLSFSECDIPDECVSTAMFAPKLQVVSLDRLNEKIRQVLSLNRDGCNTQHAAESREVGGRKEREYIIPKA